MDPCEVPRFETPPNTICMQQWHTWYYIMIQWYVMNDTTWYKTCLGISADQTITILNMPWAWKVFGCFWVSSTNLERRLWQGRVCLGRDQDEWKQLNENSWSWAHRVSIHHGFNIFNNLSFNMLYILLFQSKFPLSSSLFLGFRLQTPGWVCAIKTGA